MAFSATHFPKYFTLGPIPQLPEGQDAWLSLDQLAALVQVASDRIPKLERVYPWRWEFGQKRFSAYCVWMKMTREMKHPMMPLGFDDYFAPRHAALMAASAQQHQQPA